jgi:glycosyltransferase involved in cell wall biosynthesis
MRVLSVGRLTTGKGHHHLIRAIRILKDEGRKVSLRIGGDGPEMESLRRLIEELGLAEEVTLLGSLAEEVYLEEMRGADVFALASDAEPMGVVYMEAMACGKPAVGTAAGGVGEVITDGVDGLLVPPGDPAALAGAIGRLIDEPELRKRFGEAGRRKVVSDFDSRKWAGVLWERICAAHAGTCSTEVGKPVVSDVKG